MYSLVLICREVSGGSFSRERWVHRTDTKIEVELANGKATPQAAREVGITEQTYYRWRREFGGLKMDQAKRLKELEKENSRLKRLVAELSLEKQVLREVAQGNY